MRSLLASSLCVLAVCLVVSSVGAFIFDKWSPNEISTGQFRFTHDQMMSWLDGGATGKDDTFDPIDWTVSKGEIFSQVRMRVIKRLELEARTILGGGDPANYEHPPAASVGASDYPYYSFIPMYKGGVVPSQPLVWGENDPKACFGINTATLVPSGKPNSWNLTIISGQQRALFCSDFYLLATVDGAALQTISFEGTVTIPWVLAAGADGEAHQWDINNKGIRVFKFIGDFLSTVSSLIDTAALFQSEGTLPVSDETAARNLDFLAKYAGITMPNRTTQEVILDESQINSGDFLGVMRLDGMDPMMAWAMGSTTGHTTVAMWIDSELYICESTTNGTYWPTNGVQKTPYRTWLAQAKAAGYNVVHAPMSAEARKTFNASAALEWFSTVEGLDYGFHNLLFGWIDTVGGNYPCLPPDWSVCLGWDAVEVLFGLMDAWVPVVGDLLFNEAFNHRLNTTGLKAADLYHQAALAGVPYGTLPTIVEDDSFTYNTTRNGVVTQGRSMVCCVLVCSMWKAGGAFGEAGSEIQCGEQTNADVYQLNILDAPARPAECVAADPTNPLCQVEGHYALVLKGEGTRKFFPHMGETCPSRPPKYEKPIDC